MNSVILPGSRILVFDIYCYTSDKENRVSDCYKPATVISRYGYIDEFIKKEYGREAAKYPDVIDIEFVHRPNEVSKAHFLDGIKVIGRAIS